MRPCDGASDHPGRGFGTPFRDPDTPDPAGAAEHPRKTFTSATVTFPPDARAMPHRHGNAFVYAYVLEGAVRSQLEGEPMRTYHQGENWIEQPGAHHVATENASNAEPAELLVVFVSTTGEQLKTDDPHQ
ncbi:cupin domain-containing protein [Saccharopolyspora soli]|uniref:cupin domain-containing protein n=1 Tax=Saccharopolyspora soli TaxID=2926618 RepID=UPI0035591FC6